MMLRKESFIKSLEKPIKCLIFTYESEIPVFFSEGGKCIK